MTHTMRVESERPTLCIATVHLGHGYEARCELEPEHGDRPHRYTTLGGLIIEFGQPEPGTIQQRRVRERIDQLRMQSDRLNSEIQRIAKAYIPDYHFTRFAVSTFWNCDTSPIGFCVFHLEEGGRLGFGACRYCGQPAERK